MGTGRDHGKQGQLYQRYQDGMEDQIGALGLVLNALVLFNTMSRCAAAIPAARALIVEERAVLVDEPPW